MSKVFVVQDTKIRRDGKLVPKFDFESAEEFGEIEVLVSSYANPLRSDIIIEELKEKLKGKFTDDDYILPVGNPSFIGWAMSLASQYNDGRVRTLMWNQPHRKYYVLDAQIF